MPSRPADGARTASGRREDGLRHAQRAVEILTRHADDPVATATQRTSVGELLVDLGRLDESERETTAALAVLEAQLGPEHPRVGEAHRVLAKLAGARRDVASARRHTDRMLAVSLATSGEGHPEHDVVVFDAAGYLAEAGAHQEAISALRALLERPSDGPPSRGVSLARVQLAELLWPEPAQREQARALADRAATELRARGLEPEAAVAEAWLREHPLPAPKPGSERRGR